MPDQSRQFTIQGRQFTFSEHDVREAFDKTTPNDWANRAGYDPYWVVVVDGEKKPIKAVFRNLSTVETDFGFSTNDAKRVFERLGFLVKDTRAPSEDKKLNLVGTWKDALVDFDAVSSAIQTRGGWASWWSFPLVELAQKKLDTPFYIYLNTGGGIFPCRMKVEEYRTKNGNQGTVSPWPELTNPEWQNIKNSGEGLSQIFKTWLRISRIEKLVPPLTLEDMDLADNLSDSGNVLSAVRFGYVYVKEPIINNSFWWVNQGNNYRHESEGNYIFAPLIDARGVTPQHWASVGNVKKGDVILHYANGSLRAISKVKAPFVESGRPDGRTQGEMGRLVTTQYTLLASPIALDALSSDLRVNEGGPFNRSGGVKQGYLFKLSPEFVSRISYLLPPGFANVPEQIQEEQSNYIPNGQVPNLPLNLILYGPPGTGKTHRLKSAYFSQFTDYQQVKTKEMYAAEIAEETAWWELLAMVLLDLGPSKVADIMRHPLMRAKAQASGVKYPKNSVWGQLQLHTKADCPNVQVSKRFEPLVFEKDENSVWSVDRELVLADLPELQLKLETLTSFVEQRAEEKRYVFTTFHQSYSYEEFVEGIKPRLDQEADAAVGEISYEIKAGVFKKIVEQARKNPKKPYAIFIDEISRGNVASIFGELITLIEDDKREGKDNELRAMLPYSREEFVVPANLHIVGTMNTADRSVVALDNALRRRFSFTEMMPEIDKIDQPTNFGVDLQQLLRSINGRIERLLDRDHVIGHSYFMPISKAENPLGALQHVFANKVLPLLQEYFYGDPAKIGMVLGEAFIKVETNGVSFAKGNWDAEGWEERPIYRFVDPEQMTTQDFISIYAS